MSLRDDERRSIRDFVRAAAEEGYLGGRVLDYGCGRQPYRDIVEDAGGEYNGFDRATFPASTVQEDVGDGNVLAFGYDALLCTQVVQYVPDPLTLLRDVRRSLWGASGALVLTYPTNWPEVEAADLWRFTREGMETLLARARFRVVKHERRATVSAEGETWATGYGVIASPSG